MLRKEKAFTLSVLLPIDEDTSICEFVCLEPVTAKGFIKASLDSEQYFLKPLIQILFLTYIFVNKKSFSISMLCGAFHSTLLYK